jgi:hypothetical protein
MDQLKKQNTDLLTSNVSIKNRFEEFKNSVSMNNATEALEMENQQLSSELSNQREYYERELNERDATIRKQAYDLEQL